MSLSVTECNWFCQGQSIAPARPVVLVTGGVSQSNSIALEEKTQCLCVQVSVEIEVLL